MLLGTLTGFELAVGITPLVFRRLGTEAIWLCWRLSWTLPIGSTSTSIGRSSRTSAVVGRQGLTGPGSMFSTGDPSRSAVISLTISLPSLLFCFSFLIMRLYQDWTWFLVQAWFIGFPITCIIIEVNPKLIIATGKPICGEGPTYVTLFQPAYN